MLCPAELRDRFSEFDSLAHKRRRRSWQHRHAGTRSRLDTIRTLSATAKASSTVPEHTLRQGSNHGGRIGVALLAALWAAACKVSSSGERRIDPTFNEAARGGMRLAPLTDKRGPFTRGIAAMPLSIVQAVAPDTLHRHRLAVVADDQRCRISGTVAGIRFPGRPMDIGNDGS